MTTTPIATHALDGDHLDVPVRDIMSPGVVTAVESASLRQVAHAIERHSIHAVLIVGARQGRPLGWVTARGLLAFADAEHALISARDAISEPVLSLEPGATAREALGLLLQPGVTHVLVTPPGGTMPEGVISDTSLVKAACR